MADDLSLRDELSQAFEAPSQSIPVPEPVAAPAPVVEPAKAPETPAAAAPEAPVRDEHGRFAKPAEVVQAPSAEKPQDVAPKAQEPIRAPASWSVAAKAKFDSLDPDLKSEIVKREREVDRGFADRATQLKRYEPLEQVIAPHRERLALAGIDEGAYVRSLVTADEMLRGPNRLQALQQIAQTYGIPLQQLAQGQNQPPAQVHPDIQRLEGQVAALTNQFSAQRQTEAQAQTSQLTSTIERFAADPANLYFENVRRQVAALLRSGVVQGATHEEQLKNAYDQAVWANPETRQALSSQQAEKQRVEAEAASRARATAARAASGQITGSPSPGSAPSQDAAPTLRGELERQFAAQ